jgi:epoxide hydrolase
MGADLKRFTVNIPDAKVRAIRERLASAVLPRQMPPKSASDSMWETGMDIAWLDRLRTYWVDQYDWHAAQAKLNSFEQFIAEIDGVDVHFYHAIVVETRSRSPGEPAAGEYASRQPGQCPLLG